MHECYCPTQDSVESDNTVGHRNRSRQVIKPERYEYAANRRIDGPECSLILGQYV